MAPMSRAMSVQCGYASGGDWEFCEPGLSTICAAMASLGWCEPLTPGGPSERDSNGESGWCLKTHRSSDRASIVLREGL